MGFGVGVGLGIVPLQNQLLVLVPETLQYPLVPVAAFVMGVVAVVVQFFYEEQISRGSLRKRFLVCLGVLAIALISLLCLHVFRIEHVPFPDPDAPADSESTITVSVMVAPGRLATCGCSTSINNVQCIQEVSLGGVHTCWDTKGTRLTFILVYLLLMSSFGALIGFLLVREKGRSPKKVSSGA